ncbi:hypothetical protein ASF45_32195 [Pseudorhodoferax sp. Leaf265]|nr:hypothetical protein ASF45_32195 [Pseudorhodoferax sp. Leaf265]
MDYGYIYKGGQRTRRLGARFHVKLKRPIEEVPASEVLPTSVDGLPCDVIQASYDLLSSPQAICNPVQLGVSVGNLQRGSTGTVGLIVRDMVSGKPVILSNWHVLCGNVQARAGDVLVQPGPHHIGNAAPRPVAHLTRWLPLSTGYDAAIGILDPATNATNNLFGTAVAVKGAAPPRTGMSLIKFGALTRATHGVVDGVNGSYVLDYSGRGDAARQMDGVMIRRDARFPEAEISLEGDSGAIWVDSKNRAVALLFAGEDGVGPTAEYALAHSIDRVFSLLQLQPL